MIECSEWRFQRPAPRMTARRFDGICWLAPLLVLVAGSSAAAEPEAKAEAAVRQWVAERLGPPSDRELRYNLAWADLGGDSRPEAIVYVTGQDVCGSGGCNMYILQQRPSGFRMLARTTITRPPIAVLKTRTKGWRDVSVYVAGGGINPGYRAKLQFDGWKYLSNPSMAYAVERGTPERVVITSDKDSRLVFETTN
jgi:hypothetical protein